MDPVQTSIRNHASTARSYRQYAVAERAAADRETLPNRKAMHIRSAEVWDERAKLLEDTLSMRQVNEAGKPSRAPERYEGKRKR